MVSVPGPGVRLGLTLDERAAFEDWCLERFAGQTLPLRTLGIALLGESLGATDVVNCIQDLWLTAAAVVMVKGAQGVVVAAFPQAGELMAINGRAVLTSLGWASARRRALRRAGPLATIAHGQVDLAVLAECRWLRGLDEMMWTELTNTEEGRTLIGRLDAEARRVGRAEQDTGHVGFGASIRADLPETPEVALAGYQTVATEVRLTRTLILRQMKALLANGRVMSF